MEIDIDYGHGTDYIGVSIRASYGKEKEAELIKSILHSVLKDVDI